ncbi:DUF6542 domain-containing protein [Corynebacterium massiliense]|nr:DUF6542 domain-containing protein [Corynebacterium massiliense]
MSRNRPHRSALPVWTAVAILIAALITGLLLSLLTGDVSWPYAVCLIVSAVAVAAFVEPRGIFVSVATIPLWYVLITPLAGWLVTLRAGSEDKRPFAKTTLITSVFPTAELFPWLLVAFLAAVVIGWLRLKRLKRRAENDRAKAQYTRRATAEADRRNRDNRLSVAELIARNEQETRAHRPDPNVRAGQPRR